jgi:heme exporter protein C
MLAVSLVWGLVLSPVDAYQGEVQRVLYVHVPTAWVSFSAFLVIFISSVQYLRTRQQRYDTVAHAAAGVGIVFCGLMLATGSIWGKYAWGVWWTWEARLTTAAVLFLIYAAYLILRSFIDDEGQRGRYAAVIGIIGFLDVPIIHMSVYWWRTLHQPASVMRPDGPRMANEILFPLLFASVTFLVLMSYLIIKRRRMLEAERAVEQLQQSKLQESGV